MIEGQEGNSFRRKPLVVHLESCEGKTLGDLDVNDVFLTTVGVPKKTGIAGDVIEQSVLGLAQNPKQEPDIVVDGVQYEVKTTGVRPSKQHKGELEAKEPMSITAVSPHAITSEDYLKSAFWHKVEHLLIFYYLYDSPTKVIASEYANFPLLSYQFHEYSEFTKEEQRTLEADWLQVRNFILYLQKNYSDYESQYPRISHDLRKVLMLIDTAPKWPNKPRFRFKRSFVTSIFHRHLAKKGKLKERLPGQYVSIRDIEDKCYSLVSKYRGKTIEWLCKRFDIKADKGLKSIAEPIIVKMFGGTKSKMRDIELFSKIGLVGKSIVLTKTGSRTEDTKFFTIDFDEFQDDTITFEESQFYEYFSSHKVLMVVFEEPSQETSLLKNKFIGFSLLTFDEEFLQTHVRPVWERTRELIRSGELKDVPVVSEKTGSQLVNKNGTLRVAPNFPKSSEGVVFVRGTGRDSNDKRECVNGIRMYYQQVWVKGSYMAELVSREFLIR